MKVDYQIENIKFFLLTNWSFVQSLLEYWASALSPCPWTIMSVNVIGNWPSPTTILIFSWNLGNEYGNDPFIINDAQELLLSLNGFCFSTRKILFIWLLVLLMPFEFQFVFFVVNIVVSNFGIHFFQGLLNYAFEKSWTFFLDIPIEMTFPFQSTHNILRDLINILVPY